MGNEKKQLKWFDVSTDKTIKVDGLAWFKSNGGRFIRLPLSRKDDIEIDAWAMSFCPSTARVRFKTNSSSLSIRIDHAMSQGRGEPPKRHLCNNSKLSMWHMSSVAVSGIDLYIGKPGNTSFWKTTRPEKAVGEYEFMYFEDLSVEMREFTLYLPSYAELKSLAIGVSPDSRILPPKAYRNKKPIVIYGTSITQGGCASRGANGFVAIMERRLNSDVINLGFSGSGCGEPIMAELISEIDASMYIVDSVANMNPQFMEERYENFVRMLREARPDIPMILMTKIHYAAEIVPDTSRYYDLQHKFLFETYNKLKAEGDEMVYLFDTGQIISYDKEHPSVDGIHLTDVGHYKIADRLVPFVGEILESK